MFNFVLKRLAIAVPTILILIVLSFMLMFAAPEGRSTANARCRRKCWPISRRVTGWTSLTGNRCMITS